MKLIKHFDDETVFDPVGFHKLIHLFKEFKRKEEQI